MLTVWNSFINFWKLRGLKMKACEDSSSACCDRVCIGKNHRKVPFFRQIYGVALIYVPILFMPFVVISAYISYLHLKLMGAENIKTWSDFLPDKKSHRYTYKSQIFMRPGYSVSPTQFKLFWIFNCTWYCPVSVGLLSGMPIWLNWLKTGGVRLIIKENQVMIMQKLINHSGIFIQRI